MKKSIFTILIVIAAIALTSCGSGRTYIPYGTLKKGIDSDDTGRCLEYEYWKKSP